MKARTAEQFAAKHDAKSIIAKLEKELAAAQGELSIRDYVKDVLGTADLDKKLPRWVQAELKDRRSPGVPTLFLSDLHWGERVFRSQLGGVNEYDLNIAVKRMRHTIDVTIYLLGLLDPKMQYPGIVVPLGGDMISGDIHEELATTNELPSIPTVLHLHDTLVQAITLLADRFGQVFLPCVSGNHGRNTKKIQAKNRNATSFDWMLYQMLVRRFAGDDRVTFNVPDGPDALYRVANTTYNLTHGDQFKAGDSIIGPIGPLMRGNQKKTAKHASTHQPYDVMICGHWHRYIHLSDLIVNGTMKGHDEYADSNNYTVQPPQQALWVTHPRFGINWRMPVLCEAPPEPGTKTEWVSLPKR
jgi:hypothetical protein